jgi:transposase
MLGPGLAIEPRVPQNWTRLTPRNNHEQFRHPWLLNRTSTATAAKQAPEKYPRLTQLLARPQFKLAAVALVNKMARIAWALLARGSTYRVSALAAD